MAIAKDMGWDTQKASERPRAGECRGSSHDLYVVKNWLVVSTHLKDMLVKMASSSPRNRGENKTHLSCHHLDNYGDRKSPNWGLRDPFHKAFSWLIIGVY